MPVSTERPERVEPPRALPPVWPELPGSPLASEPSESLPVVTRPTWALLALLSGATLTLLALAVFTKIEVVVTAHGSLVSGTGATPIFAQRAGPVRKLTVEAGDRVERGQSIARIAIADLEARVDKTAKQLSNLRTQDEQVRQTATRLHEQTLTALAAKRDLLAKRVQLTRKRVASLEHRAQQTQILTTEGAESQSSLLAARENVSIAQERFFALQQEIADVDIRIAEREYDFVDSQLTRNLQIRAAELESIEAESLTSTGHARAPDAGRVESVLVTEGQVVAAGELLALIVREGERPSVVAFVADDDAAFLREGLRATIEFSALPQGEFGKASARVTRVGTGAAASAEVAKVTSHGFTPGEALVRVELEIVDDAAWKKMRPQLRPGSGLKARLETRQRRLIALALNLWNRWLTE